MSTSDELRLGKFGNQGNFDINNEKVAKGGVRREDVSGDLAQEQHSQMQAFSQAAIEPQEHLLSHYSSDDGVIDISQERMYHEPDNDVEWQSADSEMYGQSNEPDYLDSFSDDYGV